MTETLPPSASASIGYARVSTLDHNGDLQTGALGEAGCVRIFTDKAPGALTNRPQLGAALDFLRPGDTLVVWKLNRSGDHLVDTVTALQERQVGFWSLHENIDTTTTTGRLMFHVFAALAEVERDLIRERHPSRAECCPSPRTPWRA